MRRAGAWIAHPRASRGLLATAAIVLAGLASWNTGRAPWPAFAQEAGPAVESAAQGGGIATNLCTGCHSPIDGAPLSGRLTGKWLSPNITPDPISGIGAWSRDDLFAYLRHGRAPGRGQAGGPMAGVVESLQANSDAEIRALIDWMLSTPPYRDQGDEAPASERGAQLEMDSAELLGPELTLGNMERSGAALYNGACAACHGRDGAGSSGGAFPSMFHNSTVGRSQPTNLIAALLDGVERHMEDHIAFMQSFDATRGLDGALSDEDLATLSTFVLRQFGAPEAAPVTPEDIARSRLEWRGEGEPTAARGQLIASGGGPGKTGTACFSCHGLNGQGDSGSGTPRLAGLDVSYFAKQMQDYASGLRPNGAMTPIAQQLGAEDWHSLALYYAGLHPAGTIPIARPDPAALAAGEELYRRGAPGRGVQACADCHGVAGHGFGGVFPSVLDQPGTYTEAQLRLWREGTRRNDPHDLMGAAARPLTDENITALAAYLAGLSP